MGELRIELAGGRSWARPGAVLSGTVRWELDEPPGRLELRLLWYTEGRGSRDVGVVRREGFEAPESSGKLSFRLSVPPGPYSFEGRIVTLRWLVEAEAQRSGLVAQESLVVAPTPVPVDIKTAPGETG
ncbi:MAG: hypothetical protein GXP47_08730 [Acidobacteria bacterium]|nr:hypothetical protein [Acidobacteriota bacterium]